MEAERRQITVLFTDMVDFTSFSEHSGEEAAFALMRDLSKLMDEAIRQQGGVVRSFTGDGIMAVFGAPTALEDAPIRACRAALNILQRLKVTGPDFEAKHGISPKLRIGLNTGTAVIGKVENSAGFTALGDTVNFAARLQSHAEPNSVFMSDATYRLVQGLVDATFTGEHAVKGKSDRQKIHRLDAVRQGATRFEAAVTRGLSSFVGRGTEMDVLERGLDKARCELCVIDLAAEPGVGKSRLLYEFRQRIGKDSAFVLAGNCSPDGQQTPFLPFIEVVRGSFRIASGDDEATIGGKLDDNLKVLGLASTQNRSLLLHLLGLKLPEGSLQGLDGPLIGLRTRDILQELLRARCQLSPVLMILEDLHWIDRASEEVLGRIINGDSAMPLMIASTHRPEYRPPWLDGLAVRQLLLQPLSTSETLQIVEARLGRNRLPEALARLIAKRVEGNALFAEEIASFLLDRAIVRFGHNGLEFDAATAASVLPASVQSLLNSRIDRLSFRDRAVLQAAAVIGRRFDPVLLAAVTGGNPQESLATAQMFDLVHEASDSDDRVFKHALIRDALYESLLSESRAALHLKAAEQIELRNANRLDEVAEVLAHHYGLTTRVGKAFRYLGQAGRKSLDRYSIEEAQRFLRKALTLFASNPDCADQRAAATVVVDMLEALFLKTDLPELMLLANRYLPMLEAMGDTTQLASALFFLSHAQCIGCDFRVAAVTARRALEVAERIGDAKAVGRARTALLFCVSAFAETPLDLAQKEARETLADAERAGDGYNINWAYWNIAWDYLTRGLMQEAEQWAWRLVSSGRERNDGRALGLAYWTLAWIDVCNGRYDSAILNADECLRAAVTPWDEVIGAIAKATAKLFNRDVQGLTRIQELRRWASEHGTKYADVAMEGALAVGLVLSGRVSEGIKFLESAIAARDADGFRSVAAWNRITLAEIYLEILTARERPPMRIIVKNLWTFLASMLFGARRAEELLEKAAAHEQLHERGALRARINMDLGLLYKLKRQPGRARTFLEMARVPAELQGAASLVGKIDAALAELR
jgi:class 3 adenylate cyclase